MSMFSGKCDFYDMFMDEDENKVVENLKYLELHIYGKDKRDHRLKSDTIKDIAKYYPYIVCMGYGDKNGKRIILLSSDSFIDQEERDRISWYVEDVLKYQRKCKRKKIPFIIEDYLNQSWFTNDTLKEVAERIDKFGEKANINDIHTSIHEMYRRYWFEELVKVGYTEHEAYSWVFKGFLDKEDVVIKRLGRPLKQED